MISGWEGRRVDVQARTWVRGARSWSEGSMSRFWERWVERRGRRCRVRRVVRADLRIGCQSDMPCGGAFSRG